MHRTPRHRLIVPVLFVGLGLLGTPFLPALATGHAARVLDLSWRLEGQTAIITTRLSAPVRYRTAASAYGVAVDFWTAESQSERVVPLGAGVASLVSVRQLTPHIVRLSVTLRQPARFKVFAREDRVTVTVFPEWQGTVPLPPSVAYQTLRAPTRAGRAQVHVVTLDPRAPALTIRPALGGAVISAAETTSVAAARLEAVAAINGNFYSGYSGLSLPLGLIVIEGRILSAPLPRRTVFAVDANGRPWIGPVEFSGRLVTDAGVEVPISAVNRPPRSGGIALYTPEYGPLTPSQALVAVIRGDQVVGFSSGRVAIPSDGYALATAASQQHLLGGLRRGQPVKLHMGLSPAGIHHAIQGGPGLVRDGQIHIPYMWEGFGGGFTRIRTARSAIGITSAGKVLFVTVDRPGRGSTGINLPELAALMLRLGSRDAMNLDGGGSATLVVGGRVVSALPRGGERTVSSMLVALHRPVEP
ncbi:MAG: phosphodiester glycosidase family protein [Armatimonadetes bacterium]|nr:phosphodiester glycosidase family protein [Armatimonadota bacterium]